MTTLEHHTDRIAAALAETRASVREENRAAWAMQTIAHDHNVRLRIADGWLLFEAPLDASGRSAGGAGSFLPEKLMRWNASLPGGAKFGVDTQFQLSVRAEVPLIEDVDPGSRLLEAWGGIEAGLARFHTRPEPITAPTRAMTVELKAIADETGWAFTERDDGRITFDLRTPSHASTATLHARDDGSVLVLAAFAELDDLSAESRRALAVLLLRAGTVLRFARPAFRSDGEQTSAGVEVVFHSAPVAAELTQALESLAVGAALIAAEVKLLCGQQTAREYLTAGTWTPREQGTATTNSERTA